MYDASGIRLHAGKQAEVCNNSLQVISTIGSVAHIINIHRYNPVLDLYVL